MTLLTYLLLLFSIAACSPLGANNANQSDRKVDFDAFGDYWYQGKAELNSYDLEQYRYGEKRTGEAVLIFVTEDFSKAKQVKLDNPQENEQDAQKVLKLNMTKNFITGIYPYSMMLSSFTPVYDKVPAVKVAASVQEWCGQTYTQMNRQAGGYNVELRSYFEREGDQQLTVDARAEDEIWNLIRLNPKEVPTGKLKLIPGLLDQRLTHIPLEAQDATITIQPAQAGVADFEAGKLSVCTVTYESYPRVLRIYFSSAFPYEIAGWEEVRKLDDGQEEVSSATRKAVMLQDYWTKNGNEFQPLRRDLNLTNP
ncbi:hypothetical protein DXT99_11690 [Pontibacter diazotrophicus]|uniref:Septum formation inhibitor Maf n=1 Tax=Pontibacter diazotrophicus TaxID=1400979 RepID=A0A3D8LCD6_9BACT|nr:hypothetical protein [Pontibacter diazotrophicus]RDV14944.1 hypothetical protein DXT99_11690 [Pontibacter diazotrophicus]